jgi:hypothetical protein
MQFWQGTWQRHVILIVQKIISSSIHIHPAVCICCLILLLLLLLVVSILQSSCCCCCCSCHVVICEWGLCKKCNSRGRSCLCFSRRSAGTVCSSKGSSVHTSCALFQLGTCSSELLLQLSDMLLSLAQQMSLGGSPRL